LNEEGKLGGWKHLVAAHNGRIFL